MGDAGARPEQHDGDHGRGDTDGFAFVDDDHGVLVAVEVASFHVDAGYPVDDPVQVVWVGFPPDVSHD